MAQLWKNYLYLIVNVTTTYQAQLSSHETETLLYRYPTTSVYDGIERENTWCLKKVGYIEKH